MHYGEIKKCDIANGEGVRVSLFVSGCTHHCPGCFNQDTWDFHYGKEYTEETEAEILGALAGVTAAISLIKNFWATAARGAKSQMKCCL